MKSHRVIQYLDLSVSSRFSQNSLCSSTECCRNSLTERKDFTSIASAAVSKGFEKWLNNILTTSNYQWSQIRLACRKIGELLNELANQLAQILQENHVKLILYKLQIK
jgi:hypothetical protein